MCKVGGIKMNKDSVAYEAHVYSLNTWGLTCKGSQSIQEPKRKRPEVTVGASEGNGDCSILSTISPGSPVSPHCGSLPEHEHLLWFPLASDALPPPPKRWLGWPPAQHWERRAWCPLSGDGAGGEDEWTPSDLHLSSDQANNIHFISWVLSGTFHNTGGDWKRWACSRLQGSKYQEGLWRPGIESLTTKLMKRNSRA